MSKLALRKPTQARAQSEQKVLPLCARSAPTGGTRCESGSAAKAAARSRPKQTASTDSWSSDDENTPATVPSNTAKQAQPVVQVAADAAGQPVAVHSSEHKQHAPPLGAAGTPLILTVAAASPKLQAPAHGGESDLQRSSDRSIGQAALGQGPCKQHTDEQQQDWGDIAQPLSELYDNDSDSDGDFDIVLDGFEDRKAAPAEKQGPQPKQLAAAGAAPAVGCTERRRQQQAAGRQCQEQAAAAVEHGPPSGGGSAGCPVRERSQLLQQQQQHAERLASHCRASCSTEVTESVSRSHRQQPQQMQGIEGRSAGQGESEQKQSACKVCGADLSSLHYLQAVSHVKGCMAGRRAPRQASAPPQPPLAPRPPQRPPPPRPRQQQEHLQASRPPGDLLHTDIKEWLKDLGLEGYGQAFEAQEVDLTVVHMISEQELHSELGMADRLHQRRFLDAARQLAAATGVRWPLAGAAGIAGKGGVRAAAGPKKQAQLSFAIPQQQQQRQQQQRRQQQQQRLDESEREHSKDDPLTAARRAQEQQLLQQLFPTLAVQPAAAVYTRAHQPLPTALSTPPFGRSRLAEVHGRPAASLWQGAASGQALAPRIEARVEKRKADDPEAAAARAAQLLRGGTSLPAGEESRGAKRVKLEALKQELATHEQTVAELTKMIAELERELQGPG